MAGTEDITIAERRLRSDLDSAAVQAGVLRDDWRIDRLAWPHLYVSVAAAPGTFAAGRVGLRVDVSRYPQVPTSTPWDLEADAMLAAGNRPSGGRAAMVFRSDWEGGAALYMPMDQVAIDGHPGWLGQYPRAVWNPERGIVQLFGAVHEILNEAEDAVALDAA